MKIDKLKEKMEKRIGKKATNTKEVRAIGRAGKITDVEISAEEDIKLSYVIDYGEFKLSSPEEDTVVFI
ncbi:hypothetical protein MOF23_07840 [Bacillus inaquosorum]|uniref:hypothetical protein n=1 Tax=Bacillus inaquosorum TaxID=483913 RepID=UPI002282F75D|nr:hypothetical protein [Bacillus inaquosorum]MCY9308881.1 hypothetical protein [Bacillus inaquosorum]